MDVCISLLLYRFDRLVIGACGVSSSEVFGLRTYVQEKDRPYEGRLHSQGKAIAV